MKDYDLVLNLYNGYDSTERKNIVDVLNNIITIRKKNGMKVDRYVALPKVTGKSKHTVMSWFNRDNVKIPLYHLCVLSNYLNYDIKNFIKLPNGNYDNASEKFVDLYNKYKNMDKKKLVSNIEKYYGTKEDMVVNHSSKRQNRIVNICGCKLDTYYAWFNLSRTSVKIPFIYLSKLAKAVDVDLNEFLS